MKNRRGSQISPGYRINPKAGRKRSIRDYDYLKILAGDSRVMLSYLGIPAGAKVKAIQNEFKQVESRRADLVVEVIENGLRYIVHAEFQSSSDPDMGWRMVMYYWLIRQHVGPGIEIRQQVVFAGSDEPVGWQVMLRDGRFVHDWPTTDMRQLDAGPFLTSENFSDNLFAILCRNGADPDMIRKLADKASRLRRGARAKTFAKLAHVAGLRGLGEIAMAEASRIMPSDELLREPFFKYFGKEIAEKSKIEAVMIMLSMIGPDIPQDISDAVRQADEATLNSMIGHSKTAQSFDEFRKAIGLTDQPR